ncbi:universal stress protein [Methylosinus sp. PW1]|uniref:universal stress protein n=1 Tax=Methylosinus sp. PW1 TaxID=107636 RepID=UPI000561AAF1|nr:universal stress protein [Methylosinus sp. PW1]
MYKKILVPIDVEEAEVTNRVIKEAVALAIDTKAQLRFVNVQTMASSIFIEFSPPDLEGKIQLVAEKRLGEILAGADYPQELISSIVRIGSIYDEALTEAAEWGADLIVVGSRRPTTSTYLLGSNAANIVRHAKCSVLVVRQ